MVPELSDEITAAQATEALVNCGVGPGWETLQLLEASPETALAASVLEERRAKNPSAAFGNLIVGRLTELLFEQEVRGLLEDPRFELVDYHEAGENRDYVIREGPLELPVNVKVASTLFRKAREVVGLAPEDCVPISAYKAIGASEKVPDLVYVDLVDFDLRERADTYMDELLDETYRTAWCVLSWYKGKGKRAAEDAFIESLFWARRRDLLDLASRPLSFHAISAQRVLAVLRDNPRRVPGLGVKAAGTGGFNAEVNVHLSVRGEMRPLKDLLRRLLADGVEPVLEQIRARETRSVPAPYL